MLLAPEVKLQGLASDQQLAQIKKSFSKPLWTPKSCRLVAVLQQERSAPINCSLISADLRLLFLSGGSWGVRWGPARPGCVRARVWQHPRGRQHPRGHDGLALGTAPRVAGGGSGSSHLFPAGYRSPLTPAAGVSFNPRPPRKDKSAGQVFVPLVLLSPCASQGCESPLAPHWGAEIPPASWMLEGPVLPTLSPHPL